MDRVGVAREIRDLPDLGRARHGCLGGSAVVCTAECALACGLVGAQELDQAAFRIEGLVERQLRTGTPGGSCNTPLPSRCPWWGDERVDAASTVGRGALPDQ